MTRVLALDLATKFGWACGSTEGTPVSHGVATLPSTGEDIGRFLARYRDWLASAIDEMAPDEIIFEMPILTGIKNLNTSRKLQSLAGVTEMVVTDLIEKGVAISTCEANLSTIREHFVGVTCAPRDVKGKEARKRWIKAKVVDECIKRGFNPKGDDDADAIALLDLRLSQLDKNYSLNATPLFKGAA